MNLVIRCKIYYTSLSLSGRWSEEEKEIKSCAKLSSFYIILYSHNIHNVMSIFFSIANTKQHPYRKLIKFAKKS